MRSADTACFPISLGEGIDPLSLQAFPYSAIEQQTMHTGGITFAGAGRVPKQMENTALVDQTNAVFSK